MGLLLMSGAQFLQKTHKSSARAPSPHAFEGSWGKFPPRSKDSHFRQHTASAAAHRQGSFQAV